VPSEEPAAKPDQPADRPRAVEAEEEPVAFDPKPVVLQGSETLQQGEVWCLVYAPDGKTIVSSTGGIADVPGTVQFWDPDTGRERACVREVLPVRSVAFSRDGKLLATGEFDKTVKLRDPATGQVRLVLRGHTDKVNGVAFSPDGTLLATASLDKTAKLWDASTGKELATLQGHEDMLLSVAFSPDGKTLVTTS